MARPEKQINKSDYLTAKNWIKNNIIRKDALLNDDDGQLYLDRQEAATEELYEAQTPEQLQAWCEKWLSDDQRRKMKTAIRQQRLRDDRRNNYGKNQIVRVDLSKKAHTILSGIAEARNCTLSEAVEQCLKDEYLKSLPRNR